MSKTVLIVDDLPEMTKFFRELLLLPGYNVLTAESGKEALLILETHQVQIIISDQEMPGMNGIELLNKIRELYPEIVRIIFSGYSDLPSVMDAINQGEIYRYLTKPLNNQEILFTANEGFEYFEKQKQLFALMEASQKQQSELKTLHQNLERIVEQRSISSKLAKQILESCSMPVIAIATSNEILFVNKSMLLEYASDNKNLQYLTYNEILDPTVSRHLDRLLNSDTHELIVSIKGQKTIITVNKIYNRNKFIGRVIVFKKEVKL